MQKLTGIVDWYRPDRGFGVIRGDDGREYCAHCTGLTAVESLMRGQLVTFYSRKRKNKHEWEAHDVELRATDLVQGTHASSVEAAQLPTQPSTKADNTTLRVVAVEALERKRQRERGLRDEPFRHYGRATLVK